MIQFYVLVIMISDMLLLMISDDDDVSVDVFRTKILTSLLTYTSPCQFFINLICCISFILCVIETIVCSTTLILSRDES